MTSEPDTTVTATDEHAPADPFVPPLRVRDSSRRAFVPPRDVAPFIYPPVPPARPLRSSATPTHEPEYEHGAYTNGTNGTGANGTGANGTISVPHLRTAWKRKQDAAPPPGKPSAKPVLRRASGRLGPHDPREHTPGGEGVPKVAPVPSLRPPPLPSLSTPVPPPPRVRQSGGGGPVTRMASLSPAFAPSPLAAAPAMVPLNPKARPRGSTRFLPNGTIVAPTQRRQPGRVGRWAGNLLIAVGILIAVGVGGGMFLTQRVQQGEQEEFLASLGPTPTPLTLGATVVAVGVGPGGGPGGAVLPPAARSGTPVMRPPTLPMSTPLAGVNPAAADADSAMMPGGDSLPPVTVPTHVAPPGETTGVRGGPPPVLAGGAISPSSRMTATAEAMLTPASARMPAPTARIGALPTATPRTGASPTPTPRVMALPTATPRPGMPAMMPPPMMAIPPAPQPPVMPAPDATPMPEATPEPTPEPEPTAEPPKLRLPVPSRIAIPTIGVNAPIKEVGISPIMVEGQEVYIWDVASYAVGHHFSSGNPGEGDNIVLSGHNDWEGEVFRDLWRLKKGARISVTAGDRVWNYSVDDIKLLKEVGVPLEQRLDNAQFIAPTGDHRLTLVTCWPYGVDDHRLVIIARPVP